MTTCTRKLEFDAGHRVWNHGGKCRWPHGHRYVVEVTAQSGELNELGMVIDFGDLKTVCGDFIDQRLDHGFMVYEKDIQMLDALNLLDDSKVQVLPFNPTAENLSQWLFTEFRTLLLAREIEVTRVMLYETPNCWAAAIGANIPVTPGGT